MEEAKVEYPYHDNEFQSGKTKFLQDEIRERVDGIINEGFADISYNGEGRMMSKLFTDTARKAALATIDAIQTHGQIMIVGSDVYDEEGKIRLTSTPWYPDLTQSLFEGVNT
ncbi:hypothetical protein [Pseudomonas phage PA1C]|uniref:Uncharacterized protein n=2 Tax=root TaxID=1 RepID=A0A5C1K927_9CAUD|nr:hypothetical protein PP933_gp314 [Pseudomonas phage vB_PaeM_PS119XW]QBX32471.1 hypothetical protein [Pseudomonas phage PA1C]QEM42043.1 hypothetical protein [Pseudomonas phage vB_PaeM_PS119XW]BEG72558.1 hypothetical protein RVBP21_1860 [Pseudomonas phage BRkr]